MIWSQRIDPKAGEWKHEITVRGLIALAVTGLIFLYIRFVYLPYMFWGMPDVLGMDSGAILLYGFIGISAGFGETALRRTWRRTILNIAICAASCITAYQIIVAADSNSQAAEWIPFIALGGATGICAGLGARNLLATVLGFLGGQTGAWTGIALFQNTGLDDEFPSEFSVFLLLCLLFVPAASLAGLGVWAGCRFSKTKPSDSPQPPAPSGL